MLNLQLAKKYSRAIFELAQEENKLQEYGSELAGASREIFSNQELKAFLTNPRIPQKAKKELVTSLFTGEISTTVFHFILLLIDKRRESLLEAIEQEYQALSNQARGIVIVDVTVAAPMSDTQTEALKTKLQTLTDKKITLRMHEDQRILGGVIIKLGDRRIDGSITGRMKALKAQLLANK